MTSRFLSAIGLLAWVGMGGVVHAQIEVERTITSNLTLPDNGSTSTYFVWNNAGISVVSSTAITLNFSSPFAANPMVPGQIYGNLKFGSMQGPLFTAGQLAGSSGTFTSDSYDGNWQSSNRWDLTVGDNQGGGVAKLDSWRIAVEGSSTAAGTTMSLGNGGIVRVASGATNGTVNANVDTGALGNNAVMEASAGKTLDVLGAVGGAGNLAKRGAGTVKLSSGSAASVSVSTIAVHEGTLLLGAANQISDATAVTLAGGTLDTGGFADRVGQLTVSQNSAIGGLVTSSGGGVATSNDFLFSGVDLSSYATRSGATLNLGSGYSYGATINFANSNFTSWSGYSTTSLNNFGDKVMFGTTGMKASISFNDSTGLTYVTAIPEPGVYVAVGILMMLVGLTEGRRRMALRERAKGS